MKNLKLILILVMLPAIAVAQKDPSPVKRHPDLRRQDCCKVLSIGVDSLSRRLGMINQYPFTALPNPGDFYNINPPQQTTRPQSRGSLLIAEIGPGNPDNMPIWKPDSTVHYHLKIVGQEKDNGIGWTDGQRMPGLRKVEPPTAKPLEKNRK